MVRIIGKEPGEIYRKSAMKWDPFHRPRRKEGIFEAFYR